MEPQRKALVIAPASSPLTYDAKSLRAALADRMLLSEAIERVGKLLDCWPTGRKGVADGYIGSLAAILTEYPRIVAINCCDVHKGVARETKFLPTIADLVGFCERETEELRGPVDRDDRDAMLRRQADERAAEEDRWSKLRPKRETLEELRAKHGPNWGIKGDTQDKAAAKRAHLETVQKANDRALARMEGGEISGGIPITSALLDVMRAKKAAE